MILLLSSLTYVSQSKEPADVPKPDHDVNTKKLKVKCGAPQGALLGLLLFHISMNSISKQSSQLSYYLFTDDTRP